MHGAMPDREPLEIQASPADLLALETAISGYAVVPFNEDGDSITGIWIWTAAGPLIITPAGLTVARNLPVATFAICSPDEMLANVSRVGSDGKAGAVQSLYPVPRRRPSSRAVSPRSRQRLAIRHLANYSPKTNGLDRAPCHNELRSGRPRCGARQRANVVYDCTRPSLRRHNADWTAIDHVGDRPAGASGYGRSVRHRSSLGKMPASALGPLRSKVCCRATSSALN